MEGKFHRSRKRECEVQGEAENHWRALEDREVLQHKLPNPLPKSMLWCWSLENIGIFSVAQASGRSNNIQRKADIWTSIYTKALCPERGKRSTLCPAKWDVLGSSSQLSFSFPNAPLLPSGSTRLRVGIGYCPDPWGRGMHCSHSVFSLFPCWAWFYECKGQLPPKI